MALLQEKDNFTQKLNQGYFGTFYGSDPFFGSQGALVVFSTWVQMKSME